MIEYMYGVGGVKKHPKWNSNYLKQINCHPIVAERGQGILKKDVDYLNGEIESTIDKIYRYIFRETKPIKNTKDYSKEDFNFLIKMMDEVLFVYKKKLVQKRLKKIKQMAG